MAEITGATIKELYRKAPQVIKDAMESDQTSETILDIGKKNSLPIDKIGKLSYTTFLMMTGALPARAYISELGKALGISNEKAAEIGKEINTRLFAPIREDLKRVHGMPTHEPLVPESFAASLPVKPAGSPPVPTQPKSLSIPIQKEASPLPARSIAITPVVTTANTMPLPSKPAIANTPSSEPKPVSIPVRAGAELPKPHNLPPNLAETAKPAPPPAPSLPGKPITVPFKSLIEKKTGLVEAPALKSPEIISKQIPINPSPKKEASATVVVSSAPLPMPQAPVKSVKLETEPKPALQVSNAAPKEEKKSNLHQEVHRLLAEHFESTTAVSPAPKPAPSVPLKAPPAKEAVTVSLPPAPKSIPIAATKEAPPLTPKPPTPTYSSKDPYRESVDE